MQELVSELLIQTILTGLLMIMLKPLSKKVSLVDIPNERKLHIGQVPLIGGASIYIAITIMVFFVLQDSKSIDMLLICSGFLVVICIWDDLKNLSISIRIGAQIISIFLLYFISDLYLHSFGKITYFHDIDLLWFAAPMTIIAGLGFINAINMLDGLDGLSSGVCVIMFGFFAYFFYVDSNENMAMFLLLLIVSLLVFMVFNFSNKHKIFMGDAGSVFLGFVLFYVMLQACQSIPHSIRPVVALWIVAIPVMDTLTVMIRRIRQRKSPFYPDRQHIHHLILSKVKMPLLSVLIVYVLTLFCGIISFIGYKFAIASGHLFAIFVVIFILYYYLTNKIYLSAEKSTQKKLELMNAK